MHESRQITEQVAVDREGTEEANRRVFTDALRRWACLLARIPIE